MTVGDIVSPIVACSAATIAMVLGHCAFRRTWQAAESRVGQSWLLRVVVPCGLMVAVAAFAPWPPSPWEHYGAASGLAEAVSTLTVLRMILLAVAPPYVIGAMWASTIAMEIRSGRSAPPCACAGRVDEH
jgi:hypothetical protein